MQKIAYLFVTIILLMLTTTSGRMGQVVAKEAGPIKDFSEEQAFGKDAKFLVSKVGAVVLGENPKGPRVVVVPAYQARVMTSTATGDQGTSYGWINYKQVTAGFTAGAQINVFGGEERFWLGPEGGQYSLFFSPGSKFEFSAWQTPPVIDTDNFKILKQTARSITCQHEAKLTNYSGTKFEFRIKRQVKLMSPKEMTESLGVEVSKVACVGYQTTNMLMNIGKKHWSKKDGVLSIWILGMYKPGPKTTVVIPYQVGSEQELGPVVNDAYFGKVPAKKLKVKEGVLFFSGDGTTRSKIGLSPQRAKNIAGSYDAERGVLTIVKYNQPPANVKDYVNSMWELQKQPYQGDVVNAYNDGPATPGSKPLGPFYEIETSGPAIALKSGEKYVHIQETYHFEASEDLLDPLAKKLLGVSLKEINEAL